MNTTLSRGDPRRRNGRGPDLGPQLRFATLLAYPLWTRLLQRHAAGRVVPFSLLVPVVGLAAAAFAFGERPNPAQWLGTAAVLLGLAINQGLAARVRGWWGRRPVPARTRP